MGTVETSMLLLVLLGACLVALLLVLVARREAEAVRAQARADVSGLRASLDERAERVAERERSVAADRRRIESSSARIEAEREELAQRARALDAARAQVAAAEGTLTEQLAETAGLSVTEAHDRLVRRLTEESRHELLAVARRQEVQVRRESEERARAIIVDAVNRLAVPTSAQAAVTVVPLPAPELKGPVIGKDGRNIRAFEALTGVTVVIDDQSDDVVLSCFDPGRREVAEVALQRLLADGRINLERIEAAVADATQETAARTRTSGIDAAATAGVRGIPPEILGIVGQLRFRASSGQVVQDHLVETARLAASIAAEVGADVETARRAGFLHDVGKGVTGPGSGTHAAAGARLADLHGESAVVVNAIAAHHGEVPVESLEGVIVQIADAISAARPGARREDPHAHVRRMEELERVVAQTAGVSRVLAMGSGHDVRVVVEPDVVPDDELGPLAGRIARDIAALDLVLGQVTVTVVRELRAQATAG